MDEKIMLEEVPNKTAVALLDKEEITDLPMYDYTDLDIQGMIYEIRGQQVMLDSDLAMLYGYEVKQFNRQVKRNIERFPEDFMFQLSEEEISILVRYQIGTSPNSNLFKGQDGGRRYLPYVFTEQGIYMLSSVLKGDLAVRQSVLIMRTFKEMKHYLIENRQLLGNADILKITHSLMEDNIKIKEEIKNNYKESKKEIESIKETMATKKDMQNTMDKILDSFIPKEHVKQFVFKDGQPFEANIAYMDIYKEAKHSIYIVDDYINYYTLSLLTAKNSGVDVIIFSDNKGRGSEKLNKLEVANFNSEYPTISIKKNNRKCHDRFIILDYKTETEKIYHCGASSKDAGKRVCCISPFSTSNIMHSIVEELLINDDYIF